MVGFEPRIFLQRHLSSLREIWIIYKKFFFHETSKIRRILEIRKKLKLCFQNFEKIDLIILPNRSNRSNRKKSLNRLDRFIGQRINKYLILQILAIFLPVKMNAIEGTRPNSCSQAFARWNQQVKSSRMVFKYFSSGWILMVLKHSLLKYFTLTFTKHKSEIYLRNSRVQVHP